MSSDRVIRRADPHTIQNKILVGYQGWFTCAGDGPPVHKGHHGWLHWFDKPLPEGGHPTFDLFPDVSEYPPDELYSVPGLVIPAGPAHGQPAQLFSSRNPNTVARHFHWMARHGIDGAFLQRFATQCEVDGRTSGATADLMRLRDEVLDHVRAAAERENRVWAIMYDIAGVPADRIEHVLRVDWDHLVRDKRILDSPYYLHERGMPVLAIWGFGFVKAHHDPAVVARIARHLKSATPGGAYLWAGVPSQWRTLSGDMDPNPAFLDVFKQEFDGLSPWTIGRFSNLEGIDRFCEGRMAGDFTELKDLPHRVDYFPTIWPGTSSFNLSSGRQALNFAPRQGGKFLWRQLWNIKHLGARTAYVAMFDEYDESTAVLPSVPLKRSLPVCSDPHRQFPFIALDADGIDNLQPDWYLRICGFAGEAMRDERRVFEELPKKELDDYWATRPRYEEPTEGSGAGASGSGSGNGSGYKSSGSTSAIAPEQSSTGGNSSTVAAGRLPPVRSDTGAWGAFGLDEPDEAPPSYTLEATETPEPAAVSATTNTLAPNVATPTAVSPATTASAPEVPPTHQPLTPSSNTPTSSQSASSGAGVHRTSSYTPSSSSSNAQHQGATGVGRASTYSASRPLFAPPSTPPPNRIPSTLPPHARPPVHPSSPLATPAVHEAPHPTPAVHPPSPLASSEPVRPTYSSSSLSSSLSYLTIGSVPPVAPNMPQPDPSPIRANTPQPPVGFAIPPSGVSGFPQQTTCGASPVAPQVGAPFWSTAGSPTPPLASGYFHTGANTSYGAGGAGPPIGAQASGIISNPTWSTPTPQAAPTWPGSHPGPSFPPPMHGQPGVSSAFSPPYPPASPSSSSSSCAKPPVGPPSFPPPNWNVVHSHPGQGSPPTAFSGAGYPSGPYPSNPPHLPPRPPNAPGGGVGGFGGIPPGHPGGFVAPPPRSVDGMLGGFVSQASNVVDRFAGENVRMQFERGVMSVAETGSSLLGKLTKKPT